jgi:hypothetical protein
VAQKEDAGSDKGVPKKENVVVIIITLGSH